jgi:hypothetical protein
VDFAGTQTELDVVQRLHAGERATDPAGSQYAVRVFFARHGTRL